MARVCRDNTPFHDTACDRSLDDHVDMVGDLLPQGRAWPRDHDSQLMLYWRSFADTIKYLEDRACALADEFFCDTASETLDRWYETYDLAEESAPVADPACLNPAYDFDADRRAKLCAVVTAQGGNDCAYLVDIATALNWDITCTDLAGATPLVNAGCMEVGCVSLGTTPIPAPLGSNLGVSALDGTAYINATGVTQQTTAGCFEIGCSQLGDADLTQTLTGGTASYSGIPKETMPHDVDGQGAFFWVGGSGHHFKITINWATSLTQLEAASPFNNLTCQTGCLAAGDVCSPLRGNLQKELIETLNSVKPAHTVMVEAWA